MSNLQYIGARYVPAFYENPDTGDMTWKSGIGYEPLTVVTYNSDTYTSKKPVPSSVGDPASNPTYWAKTADYNAALQALQNTVNNIENIEIPSAAVESGQIQYRKFLCVGDSYTDNGSPDRAFQYAMRLLGVSTDNYEVTATSGSGFIVTDRPTFLDQITNYSGDIPRDEITDIVVLGGYNDCRAVFNPTWASLATAISNFVTYAKANYPKATIRLGFIGNNFGSTSEAQDIRLKAGDTVIFAYKYINNLGGIYLNGMENVMHFSTNFNADNVHPNTQGSTYLARYLSEVLATGNANVFYKIEIANALDAGFTFADGNTTFSSYLKGDNVVLEYQGATLQYVGSPVTVPQSDLPVSMFGVVSPHLRGTPSRFNTIDCGVMYYDNGGLPIGSYPAQLQIQPDGTAKLLSMHPTALTNVKYVRLFRCQGSIPVMYH